MFGDMGKMMRQAREMQGKLQTIQEELGRTECTGAAGGNAVEITLNGRHEVVRVRIDPKAAGDAGLLEDLVATALRDANHKVSEVSQQVAKREMGALGGLLGGGLPGL
jgi:DNA-binding YbaB/EbfC family protein